MPIRPRLVADMMRRMLLSHADGDGPFALVRELLHCK